MNGIRIALGVATAALLAGCNNQPRLYMIALNPQPVAPLANTCWVDDTPPPSATQIKLMEGLAAQTEWMIWDGAEVQYLDMNRQGGGSAAFGLGDAAPISVSLLIEGDGKEFKSDLQRAVENAATGYSEVRRQTVTVTFESPLLSSATKGTIDLLSSFDCAGGPCDATVRNQDGNKTCSAQIEFSGRQVDYEREENF